MKHARPDYDDKVICIRSVAELNEDLRQLAAHPCMVQDAIAIVTKICDNIQGGHIPTEEPVFLLRGQDRYAPAAVRSWAWRMGSDKHGLTDVAPMASAATNHADLMERWPVKKVPDMPA
jgi:hypothetical protein